MTTSARLADTKAVELIRVLGFKTAADEVASGKHSAKETLEFIASTILADRFTRAIAAAAASVL